MCSYSLPIDTHGLSLTILSYLTGSKAFPPVRPGYDAKIPLYKLLLLRATKTGKHLPGKAQNSRKSRIHFDLSSSRIHNTYDISLDCNLKLHTISLEAIQARKMVTQPHWLLGIIWYSAFGVFFVLLPKLKIILRFTCKNCLMYLSAQCRPTLF